MKNEICSCLRVRVTEFLIQSTEYLQVSPIVKYTSLSFFSDRFYPYLLSNSEQNNISKSSSWLLQHPLRETNLQLFTLSAIWISSKIHDSPPLHLNSLKSLADNTIKDQIFTKKDFIEAELVLLKVVKFEIGVLNGVIFRFVEELVSKLKEVARVGELLKFETCLDIMDLLYEKSGEIISFDNLGYRVIGLAASILVAAYLISVPVQKSEFPIVAWVKFVTECKEEDIVETVRYILMHVFGDSGIRARRSD